MLCASRALVCMTAVNHLLAFAAISLKLAMHQDESCMSGHLPQSLSASPELIVPNQVFLQHSGHHS